MHSGQFTRLFQSCFQVVSRILLSGIKITHAIFPVLYYCISKRFPPSIWAVPRRTVAKSRKNLSQLGNHDKSLFCFICHGVQVLWRSLVFLLDRRNIYYFKHGHLLYILILKIYRSCILFVSHSFPREVSHKSIENQQAVAEPSLHAW
jgi:hypothetical protein